MQECSFTLWSRNQHMAWFYVFRVRSFMRRETIWSFDPCHKNLIFVWFLHGCLLNKAGKKWLATSIQVKKLPQKMEFVCIDASVTAADTFMLFDIESLSFFPLQEIKPVRYFLIKIGLFFVNFACAYLV